MSWLERAACRGMDPNVFFPEEHRPFDSQSAIAICRSCEVIDACYADAIRDTQFGGYGIRGGTTARERKRIQATERRRSRSLSA